MIFTPTKIPGAYAIDLERREDHRGFFARSWCAREFAELGLTPVAAQINIGFTDIRGTVRGLHLQVSPHEEAKVVRCTMGAIFDVAVDLRPGSPTYRQWIAAELTGQNRRMLYVPENCAHGYQTLSDQTEIYYVSSSFYAPEHVRGVRYNDPAFRIEWPLPVTRISEADLARPDYDGKLS